MVTATAYEAFFVTRYTLQYAHFKQTAAHCDQFAALMRGLQRKTKAA